MQLPSPFNARGRHIVRRLGIVGAVLAVAAVFGVWSRITEPHFNGRTLNEWLTWDHDSDYPGGWDAWERDATIAFQTAGVDGFERLLQEAATSDLWRTKLIEYANHCLNSARQRVWLEQQLRSYRASLAVALLKRYDLKPLAPQLASCLKRQLEAAERKVANSPGDDSRSSAREHEQVTRNYHRIVDLIQRLGPIGLPILTNSLGPSKPANINLPLLSGLSGYGTAGAPAVPAIVALAGEPNLEWGVAHALFRIRARPDLFGPVLLRAATNGHVGAVAELGEYGPELEHLLPHLAPLTTNADPQVSFQAVIAVRRIQGK